MQVEEYAHDLRDFHEPSHEAPIVPVLVSTEASFDDVDLNALPSTSRAQCAGSSSLATLLLRLVELHGRGKQIDVAVWSVGRYRPTPGILEAARDVYAGHEIRALSASYADNLDLTVDSLREAVQQARRDSIRRVCFVTGVPGSGKTLAGLNAVHHHLDGLSEQALGAYLSGNGPLVEVLRYAIATDLQRRQGVAAAEARRLAGTFVQPVHRFVQELANGVHPPPEHVAVFDEAQRAWDERQMEKKQGVAASEAATMLDIMERSPDWSVIIALVGEGQEINTGEAGLTAWLDALRARPQWRVSASSRVAKMADGIRIQIDESLDLGVSVRSPRAKAVSEWADALTAGDLPRARALAPAMSEYPMLLTRDLASCREYLRDRARPDRRVGLLARRLLSKALLAGVDGGRLRSLGGWRGALGRVGCGVGGLSRVAGAWCGAARARSGDGPAVGGVGEAEGDEPVEVDRGGAVGEPDPVAVEAAVADLAVRAAHQPGDGALDHGAVLSVEVGERVGAGEDTGGGEQAVVGVQHDRAAVACSGAARP